MVTRTGLERIAEAVGPPTKLCAEMLPAAVAILLPAGVAEPIAVVDDETEEPITPFLEGGVLRMTSELLSWDAVSSAWS